MSTDIRQARDVFDANVVTLRCGCRAALEVRVPGQPLCVVRIVAASCGSPTHTAGRRIIASLRSLAGNY